MIYDLTRSSLGRQWPDDGYDLRKPHPRAEYAGTGDDGEVLWTIEVEDLHAFATEIGEKIILLSPGVGSRFRHDTGRWALEIYDDWRE